MKKGGLGPCLYRPADIPGPGPTVYHRLKEAYHQKDGDVFRPSYLSRPGHPVLISSTTVAVVRQASGTSNLREVLAPLKKIDVPVETNLIHFDFDTKEQFEELKGRLRE